MKDNLNEEILRQLSLIKFDRSKTLLEHDELYKTNQIKEQSVIGLGPNLVINKNINDDTLLCKNKLGGDFKWSLMRYWLDKGANKKVLGTKKTQYECFYDLYWSKQSAEKRGNYIFDGIKDNLGVLGDSDEIFYLLKLIEIGPREFQEKTYRELLKKVLKLGSYKGAVTALMKFILKDTKTDLKYRSVIDWIQLNGYSDVYIYQEEKQGRYLKKFTEILSKYGDDSDNMWKRFDGFATQEGLDKYNYQWNKDAEKNTSVFVGSKSTPIANLKTTRTVVAEWHLILPITDMVLSFWGGPPGLIAGSILSFIDAALYMYYDNDPYMAGLTVILSLVGLAGLRTTPGLAKMSKEEIIKTFEEIYQDMKAGKSLSAEQRIILKNLGRNEVVIGNMVLRTTQEVMISEVRRLGPRGIYKFLNWLAEKGWIISRGYNHIANMILLTLGFDYYAYKMWGKCSGSLQLASLFRIMHELIFEEGEIERWNPDTYKNKITRILDFSQPFTMSKEECETIKKWMVYKEICKNKKKLLKNTYQEHLSLLKNMLSNGNYYDKDYKAYSNNVHIIQNFFLNLQKQGKLPLKKEVKSLGKPIEIKLNSDKSKTTEYLKVTNAYGVSKVSVYNITGGLVKETKNKNNESIELNFPKSSSLRIVTIELENGQKFNEKLYPSFIKKIYTNLDGKLKSSIKFNNGYFDTDMETAVEIYQGISGIKKTGKLDHETLEKIYNDLKSKKYGNLININGYNITEEEREKIFKEDVETITEMLDSLNHPVAPADTVYTPEQEDKIKDLWDHLDALRVKMSPSQAVDTLLELDKLKRN